jgi:dihydropteroate synthase
MGIVNVTPDSFSDGGIRFDPGRAIDDALRMVANGADLLDIGGESTRPGAPPVPAEEEWRRIGPVLDVVCQRVSVPVSVDTYKASIAERALAAGAAIVNDISALTHDPGLADVVARAGAAVVLMHNRGRSETMYAEAQYGDVAGEVIAELAARRDVALAAGIANERIILDPGFGFAKRAAHSLELMAGFSRLHVLGRPLLSGPSRKSFLATVAGDASAAGRLWATAAAVTSSILSGAHIVRVHDVPEMVEVVRTADAIVSARRP